MFKHTKKKAWSTGFFFFFFFFFKIINYRSTTKNFGNSTAEEIVVKWQDMKTNKNFGNSTAEEIVVNWQDMKTKWNIVK